jgi:hypothetical protein
MAGKQTVTIGNLITTMDEIIKLVTEVQSVLKLMNPNEKIELGPDIELKARVIHQEGC